MSSEAVRRYGGKLNTLFEDAHRRGPEEFGALWLMANEVAIEAAIMCHVDQTDLQIRALLSVATLKILRKAKAMVKP